MENSNCCSNHEGLWKDKGDMFKVLTLFLLITTIFMVFKTIGAYKQNAFIGQEMQNLISRFSGDPRWAAGGGGCISLRRGGDLARATS